MKMAALFISFLLVGCSGYRAPTAKLTQPKMIWSSGYTAADCYTNLEEQANDIGGDLSNIKVDSSGVIAGALLYPFVQGFSCTADATPKK